MNKERRKEALRIAGLLDEARAALTQLSEEERGAFENLPEGLQGAPQGEALDTSASELEELDGELEDLVTRLQTIGGEG